MKRKENGTRTPTQPVKKDAASTAAGWFDEINPFLNMGEEAFLAECRRRMKWPVEKRIKHGFRLETSRKAGEGTCRAFNTMEEYRVWCERNLPENLGFGRVRQPAKDSGGKAVP